MPLSFNAENFFTFTPEMLRFDPEAMHPATFADVDPQAELAKFYADWLPITPEGTFMMQAE